MHEATIRTHTYVQFLRGIYSTNAVVYCKLGDPLLIIGDGYYLQHINSCTAVCNAKLLELHICSYIEPCQPNSYK